MTNGITKSRMTITSRQKIDRKGRIKKKVRSPVSGIDKTLTTLPKLENSAICMAQDMQMMKKKMNMMMNVMKG